MADWTKLLADFNAAVEAETTGKTPEEAKAILAAATDAVARPARQTLIDTGFAAAYAEAKTESRTFETEKARLEAEKKSLEDALAAARQKNPDAAAVRADLEQKLAAKDTELREKLDEIERERERDARDAFVARVEGALTGRHRVDGFIARALLRDDDVAKRIKAAGREVKVYRADGATPLTPRTSETLADAFAAEIAEGVDPAYKGSGVRGGAGVTPGGGGGPGPAKTDEQIREEKVATGRYAL